MSRQHQLPASFSGTMSPPNAMTDLINSLYARGGDLEARLMKHSDDDAELNAFVRSQVINGVSHENGPHLTSVREELEEIRSL